MKSARQSYIELYVRKAEIVDDGNSEVNPCLTFNESCLFCRYNQQEEQENKGGQELLKTNLAQIN